MSPVCVLKEASAGVLMTGSQCVSFKEASAGAFCTDTGSTRISLEEIAGKAGGTLCILTTAASQERVEAVCR